LSFSGLNHSTVTRRGSAGASPYQIYEICGHSNFLARRSRFAVEYYATSLKPQQQMMIK
jgi:hypothetical protein